VNHTFDADDLCAPFQEDILEDAGRFARDVL
jgi:hypothetical protein